jgi:hypothetical protein
MPREFMLVHRDAARAARLGVWPIGLDAAHDPMAARPDGLVRLLTRIA